MNNEWEIWYETYMADAMRKMMLEVESEWFFEMVERILKDEEKAQEHNR